MRNLKFYLPDFFWRIIRPLGICILCAVFTPLNSFAQNSGLSIKTESNQLKDIISEISKKTGYDFLYDKEIESQFKSTSVNVENGNIEDVLNQLFSKSSIKYQIVNKTIVLSSASVNEPKQKDVIIKGRIVDETGSPVPGASVIVKGTSTAVNTDTEGNYTIKAQSNAVIAVSYLGYETREIAVGNKTEINVDLTSEVSKLDEVVVVGYGVQKKETLTGAISVIKTDEMQTTSSSSLAQKLQGKVSGLNIRQSTSQPGTFENDIRIRGFEGSPMFVIDGIVRGGSEDFQKLSAEDIESISVLKDASAAIYGMNSDNGVIIVTTKRGAKGKTKFSVNGTWGFSQPTDLVRMANASEYVTLRQEANINGGHNPYFSKEVMDKWNGKEGTNWKKEVFKNFSQRKEFNISAEGGNEKMSFYVNGGATDEGSLLRSNDISYNKYNLRANLSAQLTNNLKTNVLVGGYIDKRTQPQDGMFEIWRGTISSLPIHPVFANDNPDYINRVIDGQSYNPYVTSNSDLYGYYNNNNTKYNTSLELAYTVPFIKGLEIKGVLGYDGVHHQSKSLAKKYKMYTYDPDTEKYTPQTFGNSRIGNHFNNNFNVTFQGYAIYKTTVAKDHNISATFVYEQKSYGARWANIRKDFVFYTNDQLNAAVVNGETIVEGSESKARSMGYIGKIDYDYQGKYLLGLIGRYDGSYLYHPDHRWGFFPVISAGWRASEEGFIKNNINWLSNLKFRGSIGTVGHDAGGSFQYVEAFTDNGGKYEFANGKLTPGLMSPALVLPGLSWTKNTTTNLALEMGFFNRLNVVVEFFNKDRKGIPAKRNVSLPNTIGAAFPEENIDSRRTRGVEFSFSYNNNIKDFKYNISGNFTAARTMWLHRERGPLTSSWDRWRGGQNDRWDDVIWNYTLQGQFQSYEEIAHSAIQGGSLSNSRMLPGDFRYADINGDGVIDGNDFQPNNTNNVPKINYGLNINGSWKGLDFNILFQGAAMFSQRYTHAYTYMFWNEANLPAYFYDRWQLEDPSKDHDMNSKWIAGEWPAMRMDNDLSGTMLYEESSQWRRSASYLRLKNIELGYSFNNGIISKAGIGNLRLFANVNNIFTIADKYIKPFDPERIGSGANTGWVYPITRTYNIGLSIQF